MRENILSTLLTVENFHLVTKYNALMAAKNCFSFFLHNKLSWYQLKPAPIPTKILFFVCSAIYRLKYEFLKYDQDAQASETQTN